MVRTGEDHHLAKLTRDEARTIRHLYEAGEASMQSLADAYDVSEHAVFAIVHGRTWREEEERKR